jgi:hypothetical protein
LHGCGPSTVEPACHPAKKPDNLLPRGEDVDGTWSKLADADKEEEMTGRDWITRRSLLHGAGATITFYATPSWAQRAARWPDHPVRVIVPYPAGGSTDVLFRILV